MKIILSRKGFDSQNGGCASPILPSGELCSMPIRERCPDPRSKRYDELKFGNQSLWQILHDLGANIKPDDKAHLDPDLNFESRPRQVGWRPLFGQADAAEGHLQNKKVGEGDVFLFFGWFRKVKQDGENYRYIWDAPDLHVIFGWLQVEHRMPVDNLSALPRWAYDHPHYKKPKYGEKDSIYIATDRIKLPKAPLDKPGAGLFTKFHPDLQLTAPGEKNRTSWRLPKWILPAGHKPSLTYHENNLRHARIEGDYVHFKSVDKGQEFILNCDYYPESIPWLTRLLLLE